MKKLICLMLAVMLAAAAGCLAESGDENEKTAFLQIKEGITAEVVRAAGDTEGIDTLKSGQFCGLIEETEHEGILWFHVFYLNSRQQGATGYIRAEEAEQLTSEKLKELMEDPDRANEILDLIDALNDYLNSGNAGSSAAGKEPAADGGNGSGTEGKAGKSRMEQLYKEVMDALTQVFNTDLSAEWEKAETAGKEAARKAAEAGQDMLDAVKDGAIDLFNKAKDAGEKLWKTPRRTPKNCSANWRTAWKKSLKRDRN